MVNTRFTRPLRHIIFILFVAISNCAFAQSISAYRVVTNNELSGLLNKQALDSFGGRKNVTEQNLAKFFRQKFAERYFYNYQTLHKRLRHYNALYKNSDEHQARALDHLGKFPDSTNWALPFDYLNGEPVDAYALRHLARQHKMVDIALYYHNSGKDSKYIQYFNHQLRSLNIALHNNAYEKIEDGNGVYEAFRSGYRVLNWLWIHNMFLNESEYKDHDQLTTIATLFQHGQHLYEHNDEFRSGNHQTRGVSALAILAILLRDFKGTDLWLERAMLRLSEHLDKEINDDGFQFERSVHYHMSDINNYFYVYQLAKMNSIHVDKAWEEKLRGLFTTLVKIAYPNRAAPVLQDDTEIPWAETNDISGAMTLGFLLFEDSEFGYFASNKVDERVYWFLRKKQIEMLDNIHKQRPNYGSLSFDDTGYYIMREGWDPRDKMMIISAGVDDKKPDHQHGDMLGIQAMANGQAILPNYQVRYSLKDYDLFKNSMVKNVALVDDELQGKQWTSNKGGSGFGKFGELPNPQVIAWKVNDDFDFFVGRHDGFENLGVEYQRQVVFVKNEFWIVIDNFKSSDTHEYKQVWQGHYTTENGPNLLRASAPDASGHDILQLNHTDSVYSKGARGKQWSVISKSNQKDFSFLTIIFPFQKYNNRLEEENQKIWLNDWEVNQVEGEMKGDIFTSLNSKKGSFLFNMKKMMYQNLTLKCIEGADLFIQNENKQLLIHSLGSKEQTIILTKRGAKKITRTLKPGQVWTFDL